MPPLQFVPKREFWFVSAFVNSAAVDPHAWARELGELVERQLRDLAPADLPRIAWDPDLVRRTVEMARSARAVASWNPYLDGFPYYEENAGLPFNKLGYFEIEVTYFPDAPERRREIEPLMTQQPPTAVLERFRERSVMKSHGPVRLDLASPVYVLTVTDEALPEAPAWTRAPPSTSTSARSARGSRSTPARGPTTPRTSSTRGCGTTSPTASPSCTSSAATRASCTWRRTTFGASSTGT